MTGGPSAFDRKHGQAFANQLDRFLAKALEVEKTESPF
jgi:uncharacterized protein YaiI (UPF0178 family)